MLNAAQHAPKGTPIAHFLAGCVSLALTACEVAPRDASTSEADLPPSVSNEMQGPIEARAPDLSRSLNAVDFGLTAGVRSDQSAALSKAIQRASENADIDTVQVPEGVYCFGRAIRLRPGVNLIGAGAGKTVLEGKNAGDYLLKGADMNGRKAMVADLTLRYRRRTVQLREVSNLQFSRVEFSGGIVRFERCSDIILDGNIFTDNLGKAAYAGSECESIRIVNNTFVSVEQGSINLSGHRNCVVASNHITSASLIDSGYAGIRLPNGARNNLVERNLIENHGRGIFILSSSEKNTVRGNVVENTTLQGVLIQSSDNLLEGNTIIDAGNEAIYVVDAGAATSPTPSLARRNRILNNVVWDTRKHDADADRFVGLRISSRDNIVRGNKVALAQGRRFKAIKANAGNQDAANVYRRAAEEGDVADSIRAAKQIRSATPGIEAGMVQE